jgi:hypothetical protein
MRDMTTKRLLFALCLSFAAVSGVLSVQAQSYYRPGPYYPPTDYPPGYRPRPGYRPPDYYYGPRVERAVYGARGRYVDVTRQVRRFAQTGVSFSASNETFGFDPYKGREKKLRVTLIRPDGLRVERVWDEGDRVRL